MGPGTNTNRRNADNTNIRLHSTTATDSNLRALVHVAIAALGTLLFFVPHLLATTYYVDYSDGDNSNNGLSKTTPWKCHPYMNNGAGKPCGTAPKYAHEAGDRFIFKGGVSWPYVALPLTLKTGGAMGNQDFYGADTTWFTGASFTKPKFDGAFHSSLADGDIISISETSHITVEGLEATGILLTTPDGSSGAIIGVYNSNDIHISDVYLHGWDVRKFAITSIRRVAGRADVATSAPHGLIAGQQCSVFLVSDPGFNGSQIKPEYGPTCVVLDAPAPTATTFSYANPGKDASATGGYVSAVYFDGLDGGITAIQSSGALPPDNVIENSTIDNSGHPMMGHCVRAMAVVRNVTCHDAATFVIYAQTVTGNTVYNISYPTPPFIASSHSNVAFLSWVSEKAATPNNSVGTFANNVVKDFCAAEGVFLLPGYGGSGGDRSHTVTVNVYNNVLYGRGCNAFTIGSHGADRNNIMIVNLWNNTIFRPGRSGACYRTSGNMPLTVVRIQNNHCIVDNPPLEMSVAVTQLAFDHNVVLGSGAGDGSVEHLQAAAAAQGYTYLNNLQPTSRKAPTVDAGTDRPATTFTTDIRAVPRPQGKAWDCGAYEYK